jgi:hypothetical protein
MVFESPGLLVNRFPLKTRLCENSLFWHRLVVSKRTGMTGIEDSRTHRGTPSSPQASRFVVLFTN